ncbi:MAG: hypothetical protein JW395_1061 [Nitrospira sp.]|nr:hypothetical protein [Nitrospira sp.]
MTEAELKAELCAEGRLRLPGWEIIRHEDLFTHGIPDMTFTGAGKTTWIEAKHATPGFKVKGIQKHRMKRLALAGNAFFLVYWEKGTVKRTYIVAPKDIDLGPVEWTTFTEGFDHTWVLRYLWRLHGNND